MTLSILLQRTICWWHLPTATRDVGPGAVGYPVVEEVAGLLQSVQGSGESGGGRGDERRVEERSEERSEERVDGRRARGRRGGVLGTRHDSGALGLFLDRSHDGGISCRLGKKKGAGVSHTHVLPKSLSASNQSLFVNDMHASMAYTLGQVMVQLGSAHPQGLTGRCLYMMCDSMLLSLLAP